MIFKQRLFTILLGLLFATVLTDQASALYDPGVGRFCSRDPIKYIGGYSLFSYVEGNPNSWIDALGFGRKYPGTPLLPGHQQHHFFPNQHRTAIEGLCSGLLIDELTYEVAGNMTIGTEHYHWQHGPCGEYNADVLDILNKNPGDCCNFLTDMMDYIHNRAECVARQLGRSTIRPITTQPWGDPRAPNNWDPNGLLDKFCDGKCRRPPRPNPYNDVIPWWVPERIENDIYQDTGVVVACVVIAFVGRDVVLRCCPAGTAATGGGLGVGTGLGTCVTRRVGTQIIDDIPYTLAP